MPNTPTSTQTRTQEPERLIVAFDRNGGLERLSVRLKTYLGKPYVSLTKIVRASDHSPWTTKGTVSLRRGELKEASTALLKALQALEAGWPDTEGEQQPQSGEPQSCRTAPRQQQYSSTRPQHTTVDDLDGDPGDLGY